MNRYQEPNSQQRNEPARTQPAAPVVQTAPTIVLAPSYTDPASKAIYVHKDFVEAVKPFELQEYEETHIKPISEIQQFGDVDSWAAYVARFSTPARTFLTWTAEGLSAALDYHQEPSRAGGDPATTPDSQHDVAQPGRCAWRAQHKFAYTREWLAWIALTKGPITQQFLVEKLEDLAETIVTPDAASLGEILSTLKVNVNKNVDTTIRTNGTEVKFTGQDDQVTGKGEIPQIIWIKIPVIKGHTETDAEGKVRKVTYDMPVRLRVSVQGDKEPRAMFRLSMPTAEAVLENAIMDRIAAAKEALKAAGIQVPILQAGG